VETTFRIVGDPLHRRSAVAHDLLANGTGTRERNLRHVRIAYELGPDDIPPPQEEKGARRELKDVTAKVVMYEAFVEGRLEAPKHLARSVHDLYFEPKHEEFRPRTIWSLSNAFTSAFKELDPIPQFKATVKLGEFLETGFHNHSGPAGRRRPGRPPQLAIPGFSNSNLCILVLSQGASVHNARVTFYSITNSASRSELRRGAVFVTSGGGSPAMSASCSRKLLGFVA
jgi:hypothetical protein